MAGGGDSPGDLEPVSNQVLAELYSELRARAEHYLRGGRDHSMHPTMLVHEACLKLFGSQSLVGADRGHLLALASTAMRCVLVDRARARRRIKRDPPGERVSVEDLEVAYEERAVDLVALDEALEKLRGFEPEMARAVDLIFFGGLSQHDAAGALSLPLRTFERRWNATRAWLLTQIS